MSVRHLHLFLCLIPLFALPVQAAGDAARGAALYESRCGGCHSLEAHRIGPAHAGVVGRRVGSAEGFDYSPALARSRLVWNETLLDRWLSDPEQLIPGQRMSYRIGDAGERADIIAYLKQVSAPAAGR